MEITKNNVGLSLFKVPDIMSERVHKPASQISQQTDITDRMDNSFYSGAVNIGHLNLGLLVGNVM